MAGGIGSRFWPLSTESHPKQFNDILGRGKSLLQETYERFTRIVPADHIFILTNKRYIKLVQIQLNIEAEQIIAEPEMRNTAPCITYACHKIAAIDPDASVVIAPSDHLIRDEEVFQSDIEKALDFAGQNRVLITMGIKPNQPHTGYGYIEQGTTNINDFYPVEKFTEKPDLFKAISFVESGNYLWNSGIFIWQVNALIEAVYLHAPEIHNLFQQGHACYNTPEESFFLESHYAQAPNISIDYAVLEHADNVMVLPVDFGWSDLGCWSSVMAESQPDVLGNVFTNSTENIVLHKTSNSLIHISPGKKVLINGLKDYVVVDNNYTLLIWPLSDEQTIKDFINASKTPEVKEHGKS